MSSSGDRYANMLYRRTGRTGRDLGASWREQRRPARTERGGFAEARVVAGRTAGDRPLRDGQRHQPVGGLERRLAHGFGGLAALLFIAALTAGFSPAFEVAGLFAILGFIAALVAVRHHRAPGGRESRARDRRLAAQIKRKGGPDGQPFLVHGER